MEFLLSLKKSNGQNATTIRTCRKWIRPKSRPHESGNFLNLTFSNTNRPSHGFFFPTFDMDKLGTNRQHHWKERINISKIAKFQSDLLKINEDITPPRSRNFTDVGMVGSTNLPHHHTTIQTSVNFRKIAELYFRALKTYHFQIWQFY